MATIELQDVVKSFGSLEAISHVDLTVKDGEFLILLGPSGCGKTTTLRSIAGLETITSGKILIDGVEVNYKRPADRDIAFCFQQYALYPHLTAYENIAFPLRTQNMDKKEVDRRVREVGKDLDLEGIYKYKPRKLSGGDQQRVALARAMVRYPKVYLMDEPLSNLDAKLRVDMRAQLRRLQIDKGVTTIYVTHDQVEAMAMSDRIAIMSLGKLQQVATPDEVYSLPANLFVANFIGSPSMNFVTCRYVKSTHSISIPTEGETISYKLPAQMKQNVDNLADGTELVLGVRPEDIKLSTASTDLGIESRLILTEFLGSENIHHVSRNSLGLKVRTSPVEVYAEGQPIWVTFVPEGVRLFDKKTEVAI